jgi:hypothetical protein
MTSMLGFAKFTLDVLLGLNNNLRYQNLTAVISKRSAYPAIRVNKANRQDAHEVAARGI